MIELEVGTEEFVAWWSELGDDQRAGWHLTHGADVRTVAVMYPAWGRGVGIDVDRLRRTCPTCGHVAGEGPRPALQLVPPTAPGGPDALEAWRAWRTFLLGYTTPTGHTVRTYTGHVLRFLAETGARGPAEYSRADLSAFFAEFAERGKAKHDYSKALRSFFGWAHREGLVDVDPMEAIRIRKPRRLPPVALSYDELVQVLIAAVHELGERPAWALLLMYSLGLRRIELAGLRWSDIRTGEAGLVVEIHSTKGDDERPPLPLSPLAVECLGRLKELPAPAQAKMGPEYVIRARPSTVTKWAHLAGVAAGLPRRKVGSHRMRASLTTHLLRAGVDVGILQGILGHRGIDTIAWYAALPSETELGDALALLGRRGDPVSGPAAGSRGERLAPTH